MAPSARDVLNTLLSLAYARGASDIHIRPEQKTLTVHFRIDGTLHIQETYPLDLHAPLIARIKILSDLRIDEQFKGHDGRFTFRTHDNTHADVRV